MPDASSPSLEQFPFALATGTCPGCLLTARFVAPVTLAGRITLVPDALLLNISCGPPCTRFERLHRLINQSEVGRILGERYRDNTVRSPDDPPGGWF
jgi:hypothetical protein